MEKPPSTPPSAAMGLATAAEQVRAGQLVQAEQLYRRVLAEDPNQPAALHGMATVAARAGKSELAIAYLSRAAAIAPDAHFELELGELWARIGDAFQAGEYFRRAIALDANRPEPHAAMGMLLAGMGRLGEAVESLRRSIDLGLARPDIYHALCGALIRLNRQGEAEAIVRNALRLSPESGDLWHTLGAVLSEQWKLNEAIASFNKAIALKPESPSIHCALGVAFARAGRMDDATESLAQALKLQPQYPEAIAHLGALRVRQGRLDEAVQLFGRAVQLRPADVETRIGLAGALEAGGRRKEAAEVLREGLKFAPDNAQMRFLVGALSGQDAPPVMPPGMVRALFDGYSGRFEEHLVRKLEYRTPQDLKLALDKLGAGSNLDVLDLGCGTGLCGPLLRPMARTLSGIDLSPAMIQIAQKRGVYDRLDVGEIVAALRERSNSYDLLVATDVLNYFGDLNHFFSAASSALRPGGMFGFSIELSETPGWVLRPSRRYAQHPDYVRQTGDAHGLDSIYGAPISIRKDAGQDLPGVLIVLRKR